MPIRQPIISMLAHVDHGKTSILDKIRKTVVASREAGAITQHVSASEVPADVIREISKPLINRFKIDIKIPGLLFIDLPGHEAFTTLRERGGSLADLAILVIDITQGIQQQTVESINILKQYKTPFVVAANKIDLINGWVPQDTYSFLESINKQPERVRELLDEKIYSLVGGLSEFGFDSERFDRVTDTTKQVNIIPLSAKTGEGLAELLLIITGMCQKYLEENLKFEVSGPAKGTVLEVKEDKDLGITADVIIYDGTLNKGDEVILGGLDGIIKTKVRALMKPVLPGQAKHGERFIYVDSVSAASGIKIFAPNLSNAIPGTLIMSVEGVDEEQIKQMEDEIRSQISDIIVEREGEGVIVKADTLGSLEAIIRMLKSEGIPIKKTGIGKVTKRDVLDAEVVRGLDKYLGVVLSFNVPITEDAAEESRTIGIPILSSNVVYDLVERYKEWVKHEKEKDKEMLLVKVQWPAKVRVLPGTCFRTSNPCIFGVEVLKGRIRKGYKVMDEQGNLIGEIKGMQLNREHIDEAEEGMRVAVSMDRVAFNKDIKEDMILYSVITPDTVSQLMRTFDEELTSDEKDLIRETLNIIQKARLKKVGKT